MTLSHLMSFLQAPPQLQQVVQLAPANSEGKLAAGPRRCKLAAAEVVSVLGLWRLSTMQPIHQT
eukprot:CAMPEP_0178396376 /NCGR_PEP_ID=MMETSP0689_2-20121128/13697_1 /TAXON_ID=160604 /ORGANISM="Amphidinium massartii, Strain CS-259" /LENGTH=63 /DNA_ID=CAMNT_0020017049 /DNA_START=1147 /DNA_END=1335 /DNA_ORIENTATION=-